jgi:hypothetical protein
METKQIIVSLTSWKKRIQNVPMVIQSILTGTKPPDKIVLNLSTDEFLLKDKELPTYLLMLKETNKIEINWVKENTKAFKKIIPTMKLYPESVVISIDDDIIYPEFFLEKMVSKYNETGNIITWWDSKINNIPFVTGDSTLYDTEKLTPFIYEKLTQEIINSNADDIWYSWCIRQLGLNITPITNYKSAKYFCHFNDIDRLSNGQYTNKNTIDIITKTYGKF